MMRVGRYSPWLTPRISLPAEKASMRQLPSSMLRLLDLNLGWRPPKKVSRMAGLVRSSRAMVAMRFLAWCHGAGDDDLVAFASGEEIDDGKQHGVDGGFGGAAGGGNGEAAPGAGGQGLGVLAGVLLEAERCMGLKSLRQWWGGRRRKKATGSRVRWWSSAAGMVGTAGAGGWCFVF